MGLHHNGKNYVLDVEGHPGTNGEWRVEATLRYRKGTPMTLGERLFGPGRTSLVQAVIEEGANGRAQGASSILVRLDIDGEVRELALDDLLGDSVH